VLGGGGGGIEGLGVDGRVVKVLAVEGLVMESWWWRSW